MAAEIKSGHLTPPLNPYSPQEIAAFQKLDLALRSHPELAREGATLLNPKALARLIQGIKFFQDTHLGRQPTSKYYKTKKWPLLKLPDEFFRNRDGDGPLFQLFVSAYMYKKEASWRQFDFQSKNRYTDNMALLKKINMDLLAEGLLKLPAVYLDDSIPKENVAEYKSILKKFGARVVKDAGGKGENAPTHIVVWDSEEHDSTDILEQEEAAGDLVEKLYLKTLTVVDPSKAKKSTGIIETTMQDSKKKGGKVKHGKGTAQVVFDHPMAFVHWWYHPSSYDEWMPAADVAGADTDVPPRPEGGPWIIGCKFIRDVAKFNEWGSEGDYAVSDYATKAKCWPELEKKLAEEAKALEAAKPTTLKIRLSLLSKNDKSKGEKEKEKPVEAVVPEKRKRAPEHLGMQPKQIGFSDSNKKLKKTVFNGMLRVPPNTTELVRKAINSVESGAWAGIDSEFNLPNMHDMLRPSLDPALASNFFVTELRAGDAGTTLVTARRLVSTVGAERIRGGGDGDVPMEDVSKPVPVPQQSQPQEVQPTEVQPKQEQPVQVQPQQVQPMQVQPKQEQPVQVQPQQAQPTQVQPEQEQPVQVQPQQAQPTQVQPKQKQPVQVQPQQVQPTHVQPKQKQPVQVQPQQVQPTHVQPKQEQPVQVQQPVHVQPQQIQPVHMQPQTLPVQVNATSPARNIAAAPVLTPLVPLPQAPITPSQAPMNTTSATPGAHVTTSSGILPNISTQQTNAVTKTAPASVPSINVKRSVATNNVAVIKALPATGDEQEEKEPLSGEQEQTTKLPSWYNEKTASDVEKSLLPEWFNNSADHRTGASYIVARERILSVARRSSNKYLTSTAVRRCVAGDAGSIMRLHQFLVTWGFINGSAIGDNAPLQVISEASLLTGGKWSTDMSNMLGVAVTKFSKKRKVEGDAMVGLEIDWDGIAKEVSNGVTPTECYQKFLSTDFSDQSVEGNQVQVKVVDLTPCKEDTTREDLIADLVDGVKPSVAKAVVDAALSATEVDLNTAQKAAVLGAITSKAVARAHQEEASASRILQEILDLRMTKLENRLSLLDDLEGMLDAERMALELERRDLYTNRCRHWFNADSL